MLSTIVARLRLLLQDPTRHLVEMLGLVTEAVDQINTQIIPVEFTTSEFVATTTYTLTDADNSKILKFTNASGCAVTVSSDLTVGVSVALLQYPGAGVVELDDDGGTTTLVGPDVTLPFQTVGEGALIALTVLEAAEAAVYGNLG